MKTNRLMNKPVDFLNNPLEIGDIVVYVQYNGTSAEPMRGEVAGLTEKMVRVKSEGRNPRIISAYKIVKIISNNQQ